MDAVWCQPFLLPCLSIWRFSAKQTDDRAKVGLFLYVPNNNNNNDLLSKCFCSVRSGDRIVFIQLAFSISSAVFFASQHPPISTWSSPFFFLFISSGPSHVILLWWCPSPLRSGMVLDHSGFTNHCFQVFSWTDHFPDPACLSTGPISHYLGRHASSPLEIGVCGSCPWYEQSYLQMLDGNISLLFWEFLDALPHHCIKQAKPHFAWGRAS